MLDFMGNEFAQLREFDESREQDWMVLKLSLIHIWNRRPLSVSGRGR